jgi:hypothetical protein
MEMVYGFVPQTAGTRSGKNEGQVKYRVSISSVETIDQPIGAASMRPVPWGYFSFFPLI